MKKGNVFERLGNYEQALENYDKVLAVHHNDIAAQINKGIALFQSSHLLHILSAFLCCHLRYFQCAEWFGQ
ncbi:MAG: tetratricopeptide repeat protein [Candidatus Nitrosopolaris sp.]